MIGRHGAVYRIYNQEKSHHLVTLFSSRAVQKTASGYFTTVNGRVLLLLSLITLMW